MADVQQIFTIANAVNQQAFGKTAIAVVDTGSFIAHGDFVLKSDENKDAYTNALMDLLGRTDVSMRLIPDPDDGVTKKPFEFGVIMRKIYTDVDDFIENNSWNIGQLGYTPKFAPIMKPTVMEHLFSKISTLELGVTIPDYLWKTGLRDPNEYGAVVESIMTARENAIRNTKKNLIKLTRADAMAHVISKGTTVTLVDVKARYQAAGGSDLTFAQALMDKNALMFSNQLIKKYMGRLADGQSVIFNQAGYKRYTPRDKQVLTILADYASASQFYLESDTYNRNLVELPRVYNEVQYWQGSGTDYELSSTSAINVQIDGSTTVSRSGIIGVLHDWEAMGVMMDNVRTPTERNNHDEYTNYYYKADRGYFSDMSENVVVFVWGNEAAPATLALESINAEMTKKKS